MLNNRVSTEIAGLSAKLITDRLKYTAYGLLVENFCRRRCGKSPDGELCPLAQGAYKFFLQQLFRDYSREN